MRPLLPLLCLLLAVCVLTPALAAPPAIVWASDPVRPGETVLLLGGGWGEAPRVEVSRLPDGAPGSPLEVAAQTLPRPTVVTPLQITPQSLKFVLPAQAKPGLFACRVVDGKAASDWTFLNAPDAWWVQGDQGHAASPGGWLRVCGKDLAMGKTTVCLRLGRGTALIFPAQQADQWSLKAALPERVPPGDYRVYVHNGCGGAAGWREAGALTVAAPTVLWKPERFSVTDCGATVNDLTDDTPAIQAALDRAAANGGGIIYFPSGRYILNDTLTVAPHVLLQGEGREVTELFWPDRTSPLPALIQGTNSFAVQDLALYATNHKHGIVADLGSKPDAGHLWITRVRFRMNRFFHVKVNAEMDRRSHQAEGDAIRGGGDDVRVTDCDVYVSGRAIFLSKPRASYVAGNTFYNGRQGWYCLSGCDGLIFENNQILGGDNQATGGGINCLDGSTYSQNVYFGHNKLAQLYGWDREAMTSDAGGGAYIGGVEGAVGTKLTLAADPKWTGRNWEGAGVYLLNGQGAGQYRRVVAYEGREATLDRPWVIAPDATSTLSITAHQGHYLIVGNDFSDATIAVQFYGISIDHVVADNTSARAGGFHNMGLNYYGFQPSWFVQYFDNAITEGNGYCGPLNQELSDSSYFAYGGNFPEVKGALTRAAIFRRNRADSHARFQVIGATQDVIIENNVLKNGDVGIELEPSPGGVLLRGNQMENIKEPYTGAGLGKAYLHPAERLAANLRAAEGLLPPGSEKLVAAWEPLLRQLQGLCSRPAEDPAVAPGVQAALTAALKEAGATDRRYSPEFLRLLLGFEAQVEGTPQLTDALATGHGGEVPVAVRLKLGPAAPNLKVGYRLLPAQVMTVKAPEPTTALAPGGTANVTAPLSLPPGAWGQQSLLLFLTLAGPDWQLTAAPAVSLGSGALRNWLVVGPFPNPDGATLDTSYYPPELRLDVAATYDTPGGKLAWKPIATGDRLDLKQALGNPGPGVAYAVAGLRSKQEGDAMLAVTSSNGCRVYLNDKLVITNAASGRGQAMVKLEPGENLVFACVTQASGDWTLSAEVSPTSPVAPGDLLPLSTAELAALPRLHPAPLPPAAEGGLAFAGGIAWKLAFSDDFNRGAVGPAWKTEAGAWEIKSGALYTSGAALIYLNQRIKAPYRLEYDASSPDPADMASAWVRRGEGWAGGYYFGVIADGGDKNKLMKNGEYLTTADAPPRVPGKVYHVIAQVLPSRVQLIVDGRMSIDVTEPRPLTDPDTLALYPWCEARYDNVKVYTAGP